MHTLVSILTKPKQTFEFLERKYEDVTNPDYDVIFMAIGAISGLISFLEDYQAFIDLTLHPVISGFFAVLLGAGFAYVLCKYVIAPMVYWLGKALHGQADIEQIRIVVAYSLVPLFIRFPLDLYYSYFNNRAITITEYWISAGVSILIYIWMMKIEIQGIIYFNRFGLFKAIINILPFLILHVGIMYLIMEVTLKN
jgi:hypothetical protein